MGILIGVILVIFFLTGISLFLDKERNNLQGTKPQPKIETHTKTGPKSTNTSQQDTANKRTEENEKDTLSKKSEKPEIKKFEEFLKKSIQDYRSRTLQRENSTHEKMYKQEIERKWRNAERIIEILMGGL